MIMLFKISCFAMTIFFIIYSSRSVGQIYTYINIIFGDALRSIDIYIYIYNIWSGLDYC